MSIFSLWRCETRHAKKYGGCSTETERLNGMRMYVVNSRERLAGQAGGVEVIHIGGARIQKIQEVDAGIPIRREPVANTRV